MFEVGFTEIILILGLALLVLGPERLPELAAKVGRWTGRARAMARQFQTQLEQEVTLDNVTKARQHSPEPVYPEATPSHETTASATAQSESLSAESPHHTEPALTPVATEPHAGPDQPQQ
jgi:sec-independent protein translocase protein TatB